MKYYCEKCQSVFEPGVLKMIDGAYNCPMCKKAMKRIPYYETPQQYEKRAGKPYPDNGAIYYLQEYEAHGLGYSETRFHWEISEFRKIKFTTSIVIAVPPVPPPDYWRPE
jgi:hypothetical protein